MNDSQKWFYLTVLLVSGVLVYLLAPILTPFLVAALLAYLGDPLVDRLEARGLSRSLAVGVVFVVLLALVGPLPLLLVPALEQQVSHLLEALPRYMGWLQLHLVPWLRERLGVELPSLDWAVVQGALREHWGSAGGIAANVMQMVSKSGLALAGWLANLVLIPVVTFYLLRDWDHLVAAVRGLFPRKLEPTIVSLAGQADEVLGAFLRGQLLVMLSLAAVYSTGLWIVGLDLSLLLGALAGLVSFVPYLGFILGILLAGAAALMQFHDVWHLVYVALVFGIGQMLEGALFTPYFVGDRIGLHPVAVIFAVMAGAQLFGFVGVLLALPVAAVVMVLLRYLHGRYTASELYSKQ